MRPTKTLLNKFVTSIPEFDASTDSIKVLFLTYFFTETLKNPQITTLDLKSLYQLSDLSTPQNFGGEIKNLLKSKKLSRAKSGYRLNIGAKEQVKKIFTEGKSKPRIKNKSSDYVNYMRLKELRSVKNTTYDLLRLIHLCEELNLAFQYGSYLTVPLLVRAILDHVPPVFGLKTFTGVANNYGTRSFKDSMTHLDNSSRKIADAFLHTQIRSREVLPNLTQIDFSNDLDVLLGEIYRVLK